MTAPTDSTDAGSRDEPQRPAPLSYRPPKGREAEFARMVAASGLSVNGFITQAVFRTRNRAERALLGRLLGQAQEIADRLHDLQLTGSADSPLALEEAEDTLQEIRAGVLQLMGRSGSRTHRGEEP